MVLGSLENPNKEIHLTLFCDERKIDSSVHKNNENWFYICIFFIPTEKIEKALSLLNYCREKNNYYNEVSFKKINKSSINKVSICKDWIDCIEFDEESIFFYKILGINRDNLNANSFGGFNKFDIVYNRFFRTVIDGSLKFFFKDFDNIYIDDIFHDNEGNLEANYCFPWYIKYKLENKKIIFNNKNIKFINSDHDKEEIYKNESQFIQLADMLVGTVSHALDVTSVYKTRQNISLHYVDRIEKILRNPLNVNSSSFRKHDISFFPSKKLCDEEIEDILKRSESTFYKERDLLIKTSIQQNLF